MSGYAIAFASTIIASNLLGRFRLPFLGERLGLFEMSSSAKIGHEILQLAMSYTALQKLGTQEPLP